jgi:HK97 gp10 family phage protein
MSGLKWNGDRAKAAVLKDLARAMTAAGKAWVAEARGLAPVRSGDLRDSIGSFYREGAQELVLYAGMPYAAFVEFGTRFRAAVPFMRPAVDAIPKSLHGASTLSLPNLDEKYHERTLKHARKRSRGLRVRVGKGRSK